MIKYKGKILTAEQEDHVNTIIRSGEDFAIQAPPGSGKTFLLLALARKMSGYGLSISFNKALAVEASKKFCQSVTCKTGHALAYGNVGHKYRHKLKKLTGKHLADTEDIGDWQMYNSPANKGYLILNTIRKYCYSADEILSTKHLPKLTIMNDENIELMKEDLVQHSNMIFNKMSDTNNDLPITHDIYLKLWALTKPIIRKDFIFFDEYQDSNPVIANIIRSQDCQKIFVGDQFQQIYCQPTGTMISMAKCQGGFFPEDKAIEDITVGDRVITYDDSYIFPTGRSVKAKTELDYNGEIISAVTDSDYLSKYIPRHQCIIRIDWSMKDKYIVYLMRKGNQFRIGKVPYLYKTQHGKFGLSMRCSAEQADAGWILSIQDSSEEATLYEAAYQAQFGIPGVCWREQDKHKIDIDYFWNFIGDNSFRGESCLKFFGLLIDMPLWTPGYNNQIGLRSTTITAAANLHDGMLMLVIDNALKKLKSHKRSATKDCWEKINIYKEKYKGKIYSLEIEKNHNYFGDGLLTHNSWRGAVNALQDKALDMLYITKSFRFGDAIADVANKIIMNYYPYDFQYKSFQGNEAVKSTISYESKNSDCIICRTNKGVIANTIDMLNENYAVHILGGTQPLTYLINSIHQLKIKGYTNHPDLFLFTNYTDLKEYADSPMGGDLKPVLKMIDTYSRERLLNILESTCNDPEEADITITTAHKAKGLEWPIVRLANDFKKPEDTVPTTEETNILYVAASRALHHLDLSHCQACAPQNFDLAKKLNYEKYLIDKETENTFNNVMQQQVKDLQDDILI